MIRIGVTGATGFVGRSLVETWSAEAAVVPIVRRLGTGLKGEIAVGDLGPETDWRPALLGLDVIVHCAGRAHILKEDVASPLEQFRKVNLHATRRLAEDATTEGVGRLIFLSTVGVMGRPRDPEGVVKLTDTPDPANPYAQSKWEAEQALRMIGGSSGLELVMVRPPMVYGPEAPGNFARFVKTVERGIPLPLGCADAPRSFVGIDNLVDFLWHCATRPDAAGKAFFVSDGEDISTAELVRRTAKCLGRPARLAPIPPALLRIAGRLAGRKEDVDRLLSNLSVDISENERCLEWRPPFGVTEQLQRYLA